MQRKRNIRSRDLGIDLESRKERELFRWFVACLLFGRPIQQDIARSAFLRLDQAGLDSPDGILNTGWDRLVGLLDQAHYVRYDFSTASVLMNACDGLVTRYGTVKRMIGQCATPAELSDVLQEFKGVGPVTAGIFVREIRPIWKALKSERIRPGQAPESPRVMKRRPAVREITAMPKGSKKVLQKHRRGPKVTSLSPSHPHSKSPR